MRAAAVPRLARILMAAAALSLQALPVGAKPPGPQTPQPQVRPPVLAMEVSPRLSPILAVAPTVIEPGEEVRISFRESQLLEEYRLNPGGFTVTIGGRIATLTGGSVRDGYIAVRAPENLDQRYPLTVTVIGYGQRVSWEELVSAAEPRAPLPATAARSRGFRTVGPFPDPWEAAGLIFGVATLFAAVV